MAKEKETRIHISGGRGFIGKNIARKLEKRYDVSVSDIDDTDVRNKTSLIKAIKRDSPNVIIALAGLMGARRNKDLFNTFAVNSFGILNLLEAAHISGVQNIIYFSSLTVHGAHHDENKKIKEDDIFLPAHPYATSKIIAEYILKDYHRLYKINAVILRPTIVVGNLSGEANALNEFTRNAFNDEPIIIYGDGKHKREYISISDLVDAVEKSVDYLERNSDKNICEAFIISSGEPISMADLAINCVKKIGGGKVEHINKSTQAFSLLSNVAKAKARLQWEAKDDVDTMIKDVLSILKREEDDRK